jgi:branched-chain amino acid transport system permease protein
MAIGFSLIFGVGRILNMAHTAFYMLTAYLIYIATTMLGLPIVLSVALAIIVSSIFGVAFYKLFFDRVKERETAVIIISVSLAILIQEIFLIAFTGQSRRIPSLISGYTEIATVRITYQQLFGIGMSGATIASVMILLSKTRLGNVIRSVAQDREIANLMGIDVSRICMMTMGISVALAGIAAAIAAPIFMISPLMWEHPLVIVLAAVILGGMGSLKGSVIGAFILGFAETLVVFLIPAGTFLQGSISLCTMILIMLIRPEGLFGIFFEEERL